ncbi:MAG: flagellar basal body protein [Candidatus Sericytochromatia bacterium]
MTFTVDTTLGQKVLDLATQRHQMIANNIANANTPNYKKKDLSFAQTLELMAERTKAIEVNTPPDLMLSVGEDLSRGKKLTYLHGNNEGDMGVGFSRSSMMFDYDWFKQGAEIDITPKVKNQTKSDAINETEAILVDTKNSERLDGNNVNVDLEIAEMIKNTSFYNMLTSIVSGDFRVYRTIISAR